MPKDIRGWLEYQYSQLLIEAELLARKYNRSDPQDCLHNVIQLALEGTLVLDLTRDPRRQFSVALVAYLKGKDRGVKNVEDITLADPYLKAQVAQLPRRLRKVVERRIAGASVRQIAKEMRISHVHVIRLHEAAMEALRIAMTTHDEDGAPSDQER